MTPFDLINAMFDDEKWSNISFMDKSKNFFIVNRMMAKGFPMWASWLDDLRINPSAAVDFWRWFMSKNYKKTPGWIYAKGKKAGVEKKKKEKPWYPSDLVVSKYLEINACSMKEFESALKRYPESTITELKDLTERMGI